MEEPSIREFLADRGDQGERLDLVVRRHLAALSAATRTRVQRWIVEGLVTVNHVAATRPSGRLKDGDFVEVHLPSSAIPVPMTPEQMPLDIIYEDDWLLVLNKPPALVVHPTYRHRTRTLMNGLLWHARGWPADRRPSLVGRLDRDTSGAVIVAKTARVHAALQRSLASARSAKIYLAVVYGRVPRERGTIALNLARRSSDRRHVVASARGGIAAITHFERLSGVHVPAIDLSLLRCRIVTGRMHQIRVHLASSGWPIVGDPKYGDMSWHRVTDAELRGALRQFPRQALHAWRIETIHPVTHAAITFDAPIPPDLRELLAQLAVSDLRSVDGRDADAEPKHLA